MTEHEQITVEYEKGEKKADLNPNAVPAMIIAVAVIAASIILSASVYLGLHQAVKFLAQNGGFALGSGSAGVQTGNPVPTAVPAGPVAVTDRSDEPALGNKDAKVTIEEFGDFQCPFCKQFFQDTFGQIKKQYIDTGKVKYVFRHFPLTTIHVNAQISAVAAECANQQGKFWDYHDLLYTNGQSDGTNLDKASLEKYGTQLGLNNGTLGFGKNKFNSCLESNSTLSIVQADQAEGTKDGVTGTPSFYINGVQIVGAQPFSAFQAAIDSALKS